MVDGVTPAGGTKLFVYAAAVTSTGPEGGWIGESVNTFGAFAPTFGIRMFCSLSLTMRRGTVPVGSKSRSNDVPLSDVNGLDVSIGSAASDVILFAAAVDEFSV